MLIDFTMKTNAFIKLLETHPDKSLIFEYQEGALVGANYHITEIKNVTIDAVDCGRGTDYWKETVVQLWESPKEVGKTGFISASKAMSIINTVDKIKPMDRDAEIKFEYGNKAFHTSQLFVNDHHANPHELRIKLAVEKTDCKAKESCGVEIPGQVKEEACCSPGSGCC